MNCRSAPLLLSLLVFLCVGVFVVRKADFSPSLGESLEESQQGLQVRERMLRKGASLSPNRHLVGTRFPRIQRGENEVLLYEPAVLLNRVTQKDRRFGGRLLEVFDEKPLGPLALNEHTWAAVDSQFNQGELFHFLASGAERFELPLGREQAVEVLVDEVISRGAGTFSIKGKAVGIERSNVLMVFHDGAVFGNVVFYDENRHYEYGASGDGAVSIRMLNPESYTAPCGGSEDAEDLIVGNVGAEPLPEEGAVEAGDEPLVEVDHVVGYGVEARRSEGGVAAMEAKIIASVDRANLAFSNSLIEGVQLVLRATIEDPDYVFPGEVSGSMGSADELGDLNNESDGSLDVVTDLKNQLGADGAAFVVNFSDGSAGIAYRPGDSLIVARTYMTSTRMTYVHELGHNLGCRHGWGDTESNSISSGYNFGWRMNPASSRKVRTIMAYDWGWARVPYFSNPEVLYEEEVATGVDEGTDVSGDETVDSRMVSGGLVGTAGAGYDGSNVSLGADNARYIRENVASMADNGERVLGPVIELNYADANPVFNDSTTSIPFEARYLNQQVSREFIITNLSTSPLTELSLTFEGAGSSFFTASTPSVMDLAQGESAIFTVSYSSSLMTNGEAVLRIGGAHPEAYDFTAKVLGKTGSEFHEETFEGGIGIWTQGSSSLDWTRHEGVTRSRGTGPSQGAEQDQGGAWFLYTEASSNFNKTAIIEAIFDFSEYQNVILEFSFHMYGLDMGTLSLDVYDGISWSDDVWRRSGQQQSSSEEAWEVAEVDLSAYAQRRDVKIRFRGVTGNSYQSDIAIDQIRLRGIGLAAPVTFTEWAERESLAGNDADLMATPQNDGVSNLLKYAFNLKGQDGRPKELEPSGMSGLPSFTIPKNKDHGLKVEFVRRRSATDLLYKANFSDDLGTGPSMVSGVVLGVTPINDDWERVTAQDPLTIDSARRRFGWITVEYVAPQE